MINLSTHKIWLIMMLLTITTYFVGRMGFSGILVVTFLLATAIIKSVFIIGDFMELRGVSLLWRAIMYGWLWVVCIAIAVTYLIGI